MTKSVAKKPTPKAVKSVAKAVKTATKAVKPVAKAVKVPKGERLPAKTAAGLAPKTKPNQGKKPAETKVTAKAVVNAVVNRMIAQGGEIVTAKEAPAKPAMAYTDADAPRIECRLMVGELSVPVDASSLEHTIGSGQWGCGLPGYGSGLVDAWPDAVWVGLLVHLGLPVDPLDRAVAAQPVKRLVQRLWYAAVKGGIPDERKATFDERDAARIKEYAEKFGGVKESVEAKSARAKTSFAKVRANTAESVYTPTAELKAKTFTGQQAPILDFFKATKFAAATIAQAVPGVVKAGLKTAKQTPERVVAFYFADWTKKGLLTRA